ncbi:class I adenylate-forming enzyme family protein [Solwaraspora sp. WMMA2080]|uniref:class I adenylate-forming enzyme family protein n=1 Tax=unclassified Solwaraspora TaxID=2627926 RepID=UPI00248C1DFA|nr:MULTISPECIES: class I adenylate-forming enzyme family protein [unclassified Solwaraspora]WBB99864.1 class I adenylate-forming enzyme family protein [Solwaraspora sp. WMMA2059]WBC21588.1 class I adenylate-forming enzyme family protein [Solwaraspora sp. WMMA2080]
MSTDPVMAPPDADNLARVLERRRADRTDVVGLYGEDGRSWTFDEIDLLAGGVAVALRAEGVSAGDRVACYLTNGPDIVFFLFGCWKLGAVPVTVSSLYNAAELAESLAKTSPRLLLVDGRSPDVVAELASARAGVAIRRVAQLRPATGGVGEADVEPLPWRRQVRVPAVDVDPQAEACVLFTGGTTGRPKAVSVTHGGTRDSLMRLACVATGTDAEGTAPAAARPNLIALPLFHSGGQHSLLFAFFVGRPAVVWERFGVDRLADLMDRFRFDNFFFLPTMVYDIVYAERDLPFDGVKSVLVAGQAISWSLRRAFEERYQVPILVNYGSTEAGHIAGWTGRDMKAGRWKPGSAGRVYPGVELEIRDETGAALPAGRQGEVVVRSALTKGYVDDDAASRELVRDGWVHTGDIGYVDDDGVLFLVGRKRDMIKCGGFQVWPEEIEDELRRHPLVSDVRVLGRPDDRLGEIPVALVVRRTDDAVTDTELSQRLVAYARDRLAHFKTPRRIEFVAALERSATGKISRATPATTRAGASG